MSEGLISGVVDGSWEGVEEVAEMKVILLLEERMGRILGVILMDIHGFPRWVSL